jgi:3',5'-cyclic AMP phosphodiesterase CpdA
VFLGDPSKTQPPGGTCSTTGYTSLNEIQLYGWTLSAFKTKYASLRPQGWRLYILQSYVQPKGELLYNAVFRPAGDTDEIEQYSDTLSQFESEYNALWPLGWRIYILDSYVQDGSVYFNAVWRPGDVPEKQNYEDNDAEFQSQLTSLYPDNWRPYIIQSYLPHGSVEYNAVWRGGVVENKQLFGEVYSDYRTEYNKLWPEGWRLYLLQSYVLSDGTDLFNAVFHPGNHEEIQYYGMPYSDYRTEYNKLWPDGWRLYILQSFVAGDGKVYYNAVWRQGTIDRPL